MPLGVGHDDLKSTTSVICSLPQTTRAITGNTHQDTSPARFLGLGQEPQDCWSEDITLADTGMISIPLTENIVGHESIRDLKIPETYLPTFKTYNIARNYTLHIRFDVECAQKLYELDGTAAADIASHKQI